MSAADKGIPAFEDDPVAMALGLTPRKPGVLIPGEPDHCHLCALDTMHALRAELDGLRVRPEPLLTNDEIRRLVRRADHVVASRPHRCEYIHSGALTDLERVLSILPESARVAGETGDTP